MSKKIIILNGSPRPNGNTAGLIEAFTKGAQRSGHLVLSFDLQKLSIHPCLGCCKGGKSFETPCVQRDDMDRIYPHYVDADIVVLASPMYYWSISGQLKCAFDRLFAVAEADNCRNPKKDGLLLMAAEGNNADNFAPVRNYFESLMTQMGWRNRGTICAGGVLEPGDIAGHPALSEASALGAAL